MASTADKRRALAALVAERDGRGRTGRLLRRAAAAVVLVLLVALTGLWALGFFSQPRALAEVRQLVDQQVAEYGRVARGEVPYESAPSSAALWERMRDLPPTDRERATPEMGRLFAARERAELGSYFALPPEQREAELDRRLKAEAERRAKWQAEREKREQERAARGDQAGPRVAPVAGNGGAGGTPGGGPRGGTEESRLQRGKQRIDRTSPDERAQQAEYRRAIEARRTQLGLPAGGGGRRGG
ncbi:MAG: hypothetical protein ACKOSQ_12185 [Planctomycetaceae bacterium]